ncbi:NAD(P)H-hydrate dehydratase [bacterium]|nr:NAD(P)H-hydrate dehydratase [bacterium]
MIPLLSSEQMRALDANAINEIGIPGIVLMENAALAVVDIIDERFGELEWLTVAVVCGPGNNGGDGFAIARQLHLRGADVDVFLLSDPNKLQGDALTNYQLLEPLGITAFRVDNADELDFSEYDLIVDAIFGTGSIRAPEGIYEDVIRAINDSPSNVIAVDCPSGVDASTGAVPGEAVWTDVTVTFQHAKIGLLLPPGKEFCGDLIIAPISIPPQPEILEQAAFGLPEDEDIAELLPPRARDAHKGDYGKLLIIAGSRGMSGAARLAGYAALRMGVGLVKVAAPESIRSEIASFAPEIMTIGLPETSNGTIAFSALDKLKADIAWADAIAVGPGLGQDAETAEFLKALLPMTDRLVLDADGLNLIAVQKLISKLPAGAVLTPHPGEFSRLTGKQDESFIERAEAARQFAADHGLVVLLKGAPSITVAKGLPAIVNPTGNPGLATAGSGDVLTGMVGALLAQGWEGYSAAFAAAYLHGRAADIAAEELGEASLISGDIIDFLPDSFFSLEEHPEHNSTESV